MKTTTTAASAQTLQTAAEPATSRRRRRTRDDVNERIREAARQLFAERGYAATTTREIARLADVSETLLFRYYGEKATLFAEVVTAPFLQLMEQFIQSRPGADISEKAAAQLFTRQVYELFENNEDIFRALMGGPRVGGSDAPAPRLDGLTVFFDRAVEQAQRRLAKAGRSPSMDLQIGVRLGLGMIASSVLLRDTLFANAAPEREALIQALEHMVEHTLGSESGD